MNAAQLAIGTPMMAAPVARRAGGGNRRELIQGSISIRAMACLSGAGVVAATLLHYVHAHRSGVPGGYVALLSGALAVGVLAAACGYFSAPVERRSIPMAMTVATGVSLATAGILLVTLIQFFGS